MPRPSLLHLGVLSGLALLGCDGSLTGERISATNGPVQAAPQCGATPSPVRRLSNAEYQRSLPSVFPGQTLPSVTLPPDKRPFGFDNDANANVADQALVDAYVEAARRLAESTTTANSPIYVCADKTLACAKTIISTFARRAFRRPPTEEEIEGLTTFYAQGPAASDFRAATELMVQAVLLSPSFLYRFDDLVPEDAEGDVGRVDAYTLASRLSFFVTGAAPDDTLLDAAADGSLLEEQVLAAQTDRLLNSQQATGGIGHFFRQWFELEKVQTANKLAAEGFDQQTRAEAIEQFDRYVSWLFAKQGTVGTLFTARRAFVTPKTAGFYGLQLNAADFDQEGWASIDLDGAQRAGVLTQTAFLASHAHPGNPSPVLRGVFVLEKVLCESVGAPPAAAAGITIGTGGTGPSTNRERYEATTTAGSCGSCHQKRINPIGYAFEHFDTMGRWRDLDDGQTIDSSGEAVGLRFSGANELASELAADQRVQGCLVQRLSRYAMGGNAWVDNRCVSDELNASLGASGGDLRGLVMAMVQHPDFRLAHFEGSLP